MTKLVYALVITAGVVMFAIGALAHHAKPWNHAVKGDVEETTPLPPIVKAWDARYPLGHQFF
jgi:hypothetical protein